MTKNKKPLNNAAKRWVRYLREAGFKGWRELTPKERAAAYQRGLRFWQNQQGQLPAFTAAIDI